MYPREVRVDDPQEALIVEQALAMYREMRDTAREAPDGEVFDRAESLAVSRGRELMRKSLETVVNQEAQAAEKKGVLTETNCCGSGRTHRGRRTRNVVSAVGTIKFARVYYECRGCRQGTHMADDRTGIRGGRSRGAERLMCLAGSSWSFDAASKHLAEFCGLQTSGNTIRKVCHERAGEMAEWRHTQVEAHTEFRQSSGDVEFETDGAHVNTHDGWREMRLGIFAKREAGQAATPDQWDSRTLPSPTSRVAFAAIEKADRFTSRWRRWAGRLGVKTDSPVHAVADGARWIWEGLDDQFQHLDGVLDVFHALEHVAEAAKVVDADGTDWLERMRKTLLAEGWQGARRELLATRGATRNRKQHAAIDALTKYLGNHTKHLDYAAQLTAGKTIGSGMVEGACKNVIGRRLKQTGARWRIRRANRMATLATSLYSNTWDAYWANAA